MKILRTKVFPKADRNVAVGVLRADVKQGRSVLFSILDKRNGTISGCARLSKNSARRRIEEEGPAYI
jgi:hypothetical protein